MNGKLEKQLQNVVYYLRNENINKERKLPLLFTMKFVAKVCFMLARHWTLFKNNLLKETMLFMQPVID